MLNSLTSLGKVAKTGFLAAFLATAATLAPAATADTNRVPKSKLWLDIGASERIDFAGRLHMLSQRIAASACNLEAGIEADISRGLIAGSFDELERIMKALRYGNPLMKIIGEEDNPRVLAAFNEIEAQWSTVSSTVRALLKGEGRAEDFQVVERWNVPFIDASNLLVSEIAAEYADPADLLQRDAILVDLAGRQRMRTQMILKQSCDIWKDGGSSAEKDALLETVQMFERTLNALRNGSEDVGIKGSPTPEIDAALTALAADWDSTKLTLATVAQGRRLSDTAISDLYLVLNDMLIQSQGVVTHYTRYAKGF